MKLAVMSDLHNEFDRRGRRSDLTNPPPGHPQVGADLTPLKGVVDAVLLAGDTDLAREAVRYGAAVASYLASPVIMVAGNHEYYNGVFSDVLAGLRHEARRHAQVHFLENAAAVLELGDAAGSTQQRLRVLGCSLWTDYALEGDDPETVGRAMQAAGEGMSDHWAITCDDDGSLFTPEQARAQHQRSRDWLQQTLSEDFDGTTIVMTHHAVSQHSQPQVFKGSPLAPCFVSNLDDLVAGSQVPLWVHGHTHYDVDYKIGNTRVVARQRGYPHETTNFWPLIIEL